MPEKVRISFEGPEGDPSPLVVIYNANVLSPGLFRQITRYGPSRRLDGRGLFSGHLQGSRKDFLAMVQSYGVEIEIVRAPDAFGLETENTCNQALTARSLRSPDGRQGDQPPSV